MNTKGKGKKNLKQPEILNDQNLVDKTISGKSFTIDRIKKGNCSIDGCQDENLLDCINCGRHDLCFNHMGGCGLTRVYCPNCFFGLNKMNFRKENNLN